MASSTEHSSSNWWTRRMKMAPAEEKSRSAIRDKADVRLSGLCRFASQQICISAFDEVRRGDPEIVHEKVGFGYALFGSFPIF